MRFLVILSMVLCTSCYQQTRHCEEYRTGTFRSQVVIGDQVLETVFKRSDSLEIDIFKGVADTSSVRWLNDCEYILTRLNPKNREETKSIHIKILTTDINSYIFEYKIVGGTQSERATAFRVEEE